MKAILANLHLMAATLSIFALSMQTVANKRQQSPCVSPRNTQ